MTVVKAIFDSVATIMGTKMNLFGYNVSFTNIFAFVMIVAVVAIFLRNLLN